MSLEFGTDGVRGVANTELTPELVLTLGRAAARVLEGGTFVVGRDTRRSGPLLEAALAAGLASEGASVEVVGVVPTPAVAFLSAAHGIPGAMISASHNPFPDNGIKLFQAGGTKLSDHVEERLEAEVARLQREGGDRPGGAAVGRITHRPDELDDYVASVVASLEGRDLEGLRVVLDCAHGAAVSAAPDVFQRLGADVEVIHARPDGVNINDGCGSTHPEVLARIVTERGADAGLAFDGDADRVIAVAGDGTVVDGDHVVALCAADLHARGRLAGKAVVVTVMSNLGFHRAMADAGIEVVATAVGDRYVLEALEDRGLTLGGEQSGHVIFRELATTGDGILTGVQLLDVVHRAGRPLSEMAESVMQRYPQVLRNVAVPERDPALLEAVQGEVAAVEAELGADGRVLLRASGTEPVVRVMVEALDAATAESAAARLVAAVEAAATRS